MPDLHQYKHVTEEGIERRSGAHKIMSPGGSEGCEGW